jgi:hypothetical protein
MGVKTVVAVILMITMVVPMMWHIVDAAIRSNKHRNRVNRDKEYKEAHHGD